MSSPLLKVTATCRDSEKCLFDGKDLFLNIKIGNRDKNPVGFPLAYLQKCGPVIRLLDNRSKAETYLRRNPADFSLKEQFTEIPPNGAVTLDWVISPSELLQFAHDKKLDVSAEITLKAGVRIANQVVEFKGSDTIRISGPAQ